MSFSFLCLIESETEEFREANYQKSQGFSSGMKGNRNKMEEGRSEWYVPSFTLFLSFLLEFLNLFCKINMEFLLSFWVWYWTWYYLFQSIGNFDFNRLGYVILILGLVLICDSGLISTLVKMISLNVYGRMHIWS